MDQKEAQIRQELAELDKKLENPDIYSDASYPKIAKRRSDLADLVALFNEKNKLSSDKASAEQLMTSSSGEMQAMAEQELNELETKITANETSLVEALTPKDPNNERDVIVEILSLIHI